MENREDKKPLSTRDLKTGHDQGMRRSPSKKRRRTIIAPCMTSTFLTLTAARRTTTGFNYIRHLCRDFHAAPTNVGGARRF
jgi:hypothetical protein